jgi:type IV pilus assembly protein PilM
LKISTFINPKVVSIDVGSYETKVVEGRISNKGVVIEKQFSFLTPEGSYENGYIIDKELLYYLLNQELKKNKVSSDMTYITIKSTSIIVREILLPKVSYNEVEGILKYQIGEYLPMNPEEYVIQYQIIGNEEEGEIEKLNVLIIAIPREIVESHFSLINQLDMKPCVMDFQSNSISKLLVYNELINGTYKTRDLTFAAIDIGYNSTNVTIEKNGLIQVSRVIKFGGDDIDKKIFSILDFSKEELKVKKKEIDISRFDEDYSEKNRLSNVVKTSIEEMMCMVDKVFSYYTSRDVNNKIHMILLYGGISNINGIENLFSNYFSIPTVKIETLNKVLIQRDLNKYINCVSSLIRNTEEQ